MLPPWDDHAFSPTWQGKASILIHPWGIPPPVYDRDTVDTSID